MDGATVEMIRVVAPLTLDEGFSFDVMVDDEPFTVLVPQGGVKEGQEFNVPYTRNADKEEDDVSEEPTLPVQSRSEDDDEFDELGAPYGRWRNHALSCCDVITQSTFWMGCCCTPVLVAQLLTRLRLTWRGLEGSPEEVALSFNRILISMIIVLAVGQLTPLVGTLFFFLYFMVIAFYVGSNLRRHVRKKYKIPARWKCCERSEDLCCMVCCSCCSAIQIARHTHDDKEYPGYGCTTTGLDMKAPEIV